MTDKATSTQPKVDQDDDLVALYTAAFREFGTMALWNVKKFDSPTAEAALLVARHLRIEGNMRARRLAERIDQAAVPARKRTSQGQSE